MLTNLSHFGEQFEPLGNKQLFDRVALRRTTFLTALANVITLKGGVVCQLSVISFKTDSSPFDL